MEKLQDMWGRPDYEDYLDGRGANDTAETRADFGRFVRVATMVARGVLPVVARDVVSEKLDRDRQHFKAAIEFSMTDDRMLALGGGTGCGKTTAAAAVIDLSPLKPGTLAPRMVRAKEVQLEATDFPSRARECYEALRDVPLLVIDDMGVEPLDADGRMLSWWDMLLDVRYGGGHKTIVTTNLSPEKFKKRYQDRIADRIRGAGAFVQSSSASLRRTAP